MEFLLESLQGHLSIIEEDRLPFAPHWIDRFRDLNEERFLRMFPFPKPRTFRCVAVDHERGIAYYKESVK